MILKEDHVFYNEYEGEKSKYSTYFGRISRGIPKDEAISPKLGKSTGRKRGSINSIKVKISYEEKKEMEELENYRKEIEKLRIESEERQKKNIIEGCIDPYYRK